MVDRKLFDVKGDQEGVVEFCIDHVLNVSPKKHQLKCQRLLINLQTVIVLVLNLILIF
jgi:hypothetical protein